MVIPVTVMTTKYLGISNYIKELHICRYGYTSPIQDSLQTFVIINRKRTCIALIKYIPQNYPRHFLSFQTQSIIVCI